MSTDTTEPNTKYVSLKLPVPRDVSAYSPHRHYLQRKKYRSEPSIKPWIVEEVLAEGECRGLAHNDGGLGIEDDEGDILSRFVFEREIWSEGVHEWTVVVAIKPKAFVADESHLILTAYCKCHDEDGPDCGE